MNDRVAVHPHSTSRTQATTHVHATPNYSAETSRAIDAQIWLTELAELNTPDLVLRCRIPVRVERSSEMNCFLAEDDVFQWHGQGETALAALQDLADVIAEDYNELRNWPGTLSRPLRQRLNTMKRYIGDAR